MNQSSKSGLFAIAVSLMALMSISAPLGAQDIYDDIYYDSSSEKAVVNQPVKAASNVYNTTVADYPSADSYVFNSGSTRSVDEYNRRGIFAIDTVANEASADTIGGDFAYTHQIERFYNPDVVVGSSDPTLAQVYYAEPANINIVVNNPYPSWYWGWPYYSSYYYSPWGYYPSSWYYGPSWSWTWGWGPSWAWGYDPYWGYGPCWGWGHSWGWNVPPRPYNPRHHGAWASNRPTGYPGGGRPAGGRPGSGQRPGANVGASGRHPGTVQPSGGRPGNVGTSVRPATDGTSLRPGATNSGYRPSADNSVKVQQSAYRPGQLTNGFKTGVTASPVSTELKRPSSINNNYNVNSGSRPGSTLNSNYGKNQTTSRPSYNVNTNSNTTRKTYNTNTTHQRQGSYSRPSGGSRSSGGMRSGGGGGRHGRH